MEATSEAIREDTARPGSQERAPVRRREQASICVSRFSNTWSDAEDQVIRDNRRLPAKEIAELLPGRSVRAIATRSRRIGVFKVWDRNEKTILFDNSNMTARQLQRLLPGRSIKSIQTQRSAMGLKPVFRKPEKSKRKLKRTGNPVIDAVIERCEEDRIGLKTLDREIGGRYFQHSPTDPKGLEWIAKAVAFFGGKGLLIDENANITIDWHDE
jgi:hypothetical protein